jgi:hypothetical protein
MAGFWRKCRITFRCVRFVVWALALLVIGAFLWLNRVGVPDFLKARLQATLQERGVSLEFSRMRWHLVHGFVAENVRAGQTNDANSVFFSAREVQLKLDLPALLHRRIQVAGLGLQQGRVEWSLSPTNQLILTNVQTQLRFPDRDTWTLDHFDADFIGAGITLSGEIRHAQEMRHWKLFAPSSAGAATDRGAVARLVKDISSQLERIHFEAHPQLSATLDVDAADVHSFSARLIVQATAVHTPWVAARRLELTAQLTAPADAPTNPPAVWGLWSNASPFRLTWSCRAGSALYGGVAATGLECSGSWNAPAFTVTRLAAHLGGGQMTAAATLDVGTRALAFTNDTRFDVHVLAPALPPVVRGYLAEVTGARLPQLQVAGSLVLPPWEGGAAGKDLLASLQFSGSFACTNLGWARWGTLDWLQTHFSLSNQVLRLPDFELAQGRTHLWLATEQGLADRTFTAQLQGKLDAASVAPWVSSNQLARFDFTTPLALEVTAAGRQDQWRQAGASAHLALTNFSVMDQWVDYVQLDVQGSNQFWNLPGLKLKQKATQLQLAATVDELAGRFQARLAGDFDPNCIRPFLVSSNAVRGFDHLQFGAPVNLAVQAAGNLRDFSRLTATGQLAVADFAIRSQKLDHVTTTLSYTNLTAQFYQTHLDRAGGAEQFDAEKVMLDLATKKLFIIHGIGHVEPMVVGRAIGPKTAEVMAAYEFLAIPHARVNGCIPLQFENGELIPDEADINFDVVGTTPFRWRKFETTGITGTIHWLGNDLIITNAISECYGGEARGWADFDLHTPGDGTDFNFFLTGTNVNFHRMGQALWSPTNHLEGLLSGTVTLTSANSADWQTWNGYGQMQLQDGLLWDVPLFGMISPALNIISPGLANNRAKQAYGDFIMTNGVIHTDTLKIRTTTMQLDYVGTVDLQERVNAKVTAQILHTTPVFGPLVSTVLWPVSKVFECRVTGTLGQPNAVPIYVPFPKLFAVPLHPIRSMEELFTPAPIP